MDYARRGSEQDGAVVGGAYEPGAAERQASQSGWVTDRSAGVDAGDRAGGIGYFDGVGAAPAADPALVAQLVTFVDACLPVGLGVDVRGSFGLVVGVGGEGAATAVIVNQGEGWVEIDATVALTIGLPGLVGGKLGRSGAEVGGGIDGSTTARRRFRVPWSRLFHSEVLRGLLGTVLLQSSGVEVGLRVLGLVLPGQDLNPFLLEESYAVQGSAGLEASLGALGEEVSWLLRGTAGATVALAWDDLPDDRAHREGTLTFSATGEVLHQVGLRLEQTAGVDVDVPLPDARATGALVVPITEDGGVITFGAPWVRLSGSAAIANGAAEAGVAVGPDHAAVDAKVTRSAQDPDARATVDQVTKVVNLATSGIIDLDGPRSTVTVGLSVPIDRALLAESGATAEEVVRYLFTGQTAPALAAVLARVDAALAAGTVTVGVDLTWLSATLEGDAEVGEGVKLGGSLEAGGAVVYRNDDVSGLLPACPTARDVVALLRSAPPSA
jgi:hypothetical protein